MSLWWHRQLATEVSIQTVSSTRVATPTLSAAAPRTLLSQLGSDTASIPSFSAHELGPGVVLRSLRLRR